MASSEFEFRLLRNDEAAQLHDFDTYIFAANQEDEADDLLQPEWTHAAFHAGRMVAISAGLPFQMRMNGRGAMVDGVTAVGTDPSFRRRGLARRLITDRLARAHENGQSAAVLWASLGAIHQRFGYGLASAQVEYSFDPRFAAFQFGEPADGRTRRLEKDEAVPVISQLHRAFIEPRNLQLHRTPLLWELPFRIRKGRKTYCVVHYDSAGEADGYLLYTVSALAKAEGPIGEQELSFSDFVWRDMNGYRGLWDFLRSHDLANKVTTFSAAEDDPAPSTLLEPRILQRHTSDGIWLRVADVAKTLAERGYDMAGETTLAIMEDNECPWNVGAYRLATDATNAEAEKIDGEAEVTITLQGLASLLAGYTAMSQLVRIGRAAVRNSKRLPELDALFSTRYRPHCMIHF